MLALTFLFIFLYFSHTHHDIKTEYKITRNIKHFLEDIHFLKGFSLKNKHMKPVISSVSYYR